MYDLIIIGSGIGAAGLISKVKKEYKNKKICIISKANSSVVNFKGSETFDYEYLVRAKLGNIHDWGGVLTLSNYVLNNFEKNFYSKAIENYFTFSGEKDLGNQLISSLLKEELTPTKLTNSISHRKLLISDRKLLEKSFKKQTSDLNVTTIHDNVYSFSKTAETYQVVTDSKVTLKAKKIALCAGAINSRQILINSGYLENESFYATDSKFGRIGRLRFEQKLPFGFFHHHMISKKIRFKTGFETNETNDAMFFLQPAIRGVDASEIHLLKAFLTLKTNFTIKNILNFVSNPKAILQILLMEFSFFNKTTDFDVYCISDFGKCKFNSVMDAYSVDINGFDNNLISSYAKFIEYLEQFSFVEAVDHNRLEPIINNMESALHMCGSVHYNLSVSYNKNNRLYSLSDDSNIIINDNSIIHSKGIANPSIQLF